MKSITIHKIDDRLNARIREIASREGASLNQTIKNILAESLGETDKPTKDNRREFTDLFGVWTEQDLLEFTEAAKEFEEIDPEDWQ